MMKGLILKIRMATLPYTAVKEPCLSAAPGAG